jgi:stage II sporulation protein AA (anti-sigma F factor antagonist)
MGSIDLSSHVSPGYVLVALRELDVSGAAATERALASAAAPSSRVIVDLAELTFLDCCCVYALASAWKQARQAGGDLLLASPRALVLRLLSLTGLIALLRVFASVEEATSGAGRGPAPVGLTAELAET